MHQTCPFKFVVLKSEIYQNFNGIVREIEKWAEILNNRPS
jgi:hypothetical protein